MSTITRLTNSWLGVDLDTGILYFWDGSVYQPLVAAAGYITSARAINTSGGLTGGGDLSADRSLSLASIATARVLANTSGGSAAPVATTLSALLDAAISSAVGSRLYRGASAWKTAAAYSLQVPTTGFAITIGADTESLLLNPAGTLLAGTITMPATPDDGFVQRIASTQQITALTVAANSGQTIAGAPTTLAAGGGAAFQFTAAGSLWIRLY